MNPLGNIFDLVKNAQQMADKMKDSQAELARKTVTGQSGAGMVAATVNGVGELISLKLEPSAITPDDPEMLADLIVAAVADARKKTSALRDEAVKDLTGGLDLSSLGISIPNM